MFINNFNHFSIMKKTAKLGGIALLLTLTINVHAQNFLTKEKLQKWEPAKTVKVARISEDSDTTIIKFCFGGSDDNIMCAIEEVIRFPKSTETGQLQHTWILVKDDTAIPKEDYKKTSKWKDYTPQSMNLYYSYQSIPNPKYCDSIRNKITILDERIDSLYDGKWVFPPSESYYDAPWREQFWKALEEKENIIKGKRAKELFESLHSRAIMSVPESNYIEDTTSFISFYGKDGCIINRGVNDFIWVKYNKNKQPQSIDNVYYEDSKYYEVGHGVKYSYDNDGKRVKAKHYSYNISDNGKIYKEKLTSSYQYTSDKIKTPIENKSGINMMLLLDVLSNASLNNDDLIAYQICELYYRYNEVWPYLPITTIHHNVSTRYHWTLDSHDLPVKLEEVTKLEHYDENIEDIINSERRIVYLFTW